MIAPTGKTEDLVWMLHRPVASDPGLCFIGLNFQRTLNPALIMGVGKDAEYIASAIAKRGSVRSLSG